MMVRILCYTSFALGSILALPGHLLIQFAYWLEELSE